MLSDIRYAIRTLRRTPSFSVMAVLILALGIGISAAVFSVVDGVLLRPLPYPAPDRLVRLFERQTGSERMNFAGANLRDVRTTNRTFTAIAGYGSGTATVLGADQPLRALITGITPEFFNVFAVPAERGRAIARGEGVVGGPQAAVVSHAFWMSALGGTRDIAGRTLRIGSDAYAIVGVMPASFDFPAGTEVWLTEPDDNPSRSAHNWSVVGRLAPGVSVPQARSELDGVLHRLKLEYGTSTDAEGVTVVTLHDELAHTARTSLLVLMGAVGLVLLLGCVNLASANLARAETRQREMAVRTALGATRSRLVRQLLTESILLALVGGVFGVWLAYALTHVLLSFAPGAIPAFADVRVDLSVLAFTAGVSLLAGLIIGVAPTWQTTRDPGHAIASGGGVGLAGARRQTRGLLIGAQVALALVLLAGAGLLVKSFRTLIETDPGFRGERVTTASAALPSSLYSDAGHVTAFVDQLLPSLRAIPEVESVGLINAAPLSGGGGNTGLYVDGGTQVTAEADYRVVDSVYFRTLGIPLLQGRGFSADDRAGAPHAALVNKAMARKLWPGGSAIGHRIRPPGMDDHGDEWLTIVGVVGDVRSAGLDVPAAPAMFVSYTQRPERLKNGVTFVVRSAMATTRLTPAIRDLVHTVDPNVPVQVTSFDALVASSVAPRRFSTAVLSVFGVLALMLAAVGIYGMLAYSVAERRREIGMRMALGASRRRVQVMVLGDAMRAVLPGIAVGIVGALALTGLLRAQLYGVSASDASTLIVVSLLIAVVALLASFIPARRASNVDPMTALRTD
jgi:putative ABC transport system permease protein